MYTSNLRGIDAGLMTVGQTVTGLYMAIPPDVQEFNVQGSCGAPCLGGVRHNLFLLIENVALSPFRISYRACLK